MAKKWFGVKTLYKWHAVRGTIDENQKDSILIEERVLLFFAKNDVEAVKMAKKEASEYTCETFKNPYNQTVKLTCLNSYNVFELFDSPEDGVEVFSSTELQMTKMTSSEILARKAGPSHGRAERKLRMKFSNSG